MALTRLLISGAGEVDDAWSAKTGDRNGGGGGWKHREAHYDANNLINYRCQPSGKTVFSLLFPLPVAKDSLHFAGIFLVLWRRAQFYANLIYLRAIIFMGKCPWATPTLAPYSQ